MNRREKAALRSEFKKKIHCKASLHAVKIVAITNTKVKYIVIFLT
jgi:hypothetical protein